MMAPLCILAAVACAGWCAAMVLLPAETRKSLTGPVRLPWV